MEGDMPAKPTGKRSVKKGTVKKLGKGQLKVKHDKVKIKHLTNSLAHIISWLEAVREALLCLDPELCLPCDTPTIDKDGGFIVAGDKPTPPRMGNCPPPEEE